MGQSRYFGKRTPFKPHLIYNVPDGIGGEVGKVRTDVDAAFLQQQNEAGGATRPVNPYLGQIFFNTGTGSFEGWNGSSWQSLGGGGGGGNSGTYTAAAGVAVHKVVKVSAADTVALAQADAAADAAIGVVSALAGGVATVVYVGEVTGFVGLVPDTEYYLDPAVPGGITATAPSAHGQIVQVIGIAKDATTLVVDVQEDFIQL